jgi:hypothetical protein
MKKIFAAAALAALTFAPAAFAVPKTVNGQEKSDILKEINSQQPGLKGSIENVKLGAPKGDIRKFSATENELWGGAWKTTGTFNTKTDKIVKQNTIETN